MAKRPILNKKVAKVRKAMRRTPPAYIDLVAWLKDRRYAQTTGEAEQIILDGRLRVDSHPIGKSQDKRLKKERRLKAALRPGDLDEDDYEVVPVAARHVPKAQTIGMKVVGA